MASVVPHAGLLIEIVYCSTSPTLTRVSEAVLEIVMSPQGAPVAAGAGAEVAAGAVGGTVVAVGVTKIVMPA